jgi:hypothetical protein
MTAETRRRHIEMEARKESKPKPTSLRMEDGLGEVDHTFLCLILARLRRWGQSGHGGSEDRQHPRSGVLEQIRILQEQQPRRYPSHDDGIGEEMQAMGMEVMEWNGRVCWV